MRTSELLHGYFTAAPETDPEITTLSVHTSGIVPGALWFCIPGARFDPRPLLPQAAQKGAVAAVVPEGTQKGDCSLPLFPVQNIRAATAMAYARFYPLPRPLHLIGITGTNGKTSTAFLLEHLLRKSGLRTALIGTAGIYRDGILQRGLSGTMTTPPPEVLYPFLAECSAVGVTHVVMEVSSQALLQERVSPLQFDMGIFTNLSPEHLDAHGDMAHYAAAKARLFSLCRCAIGNAEESYSEYITSPCQERVFYGQGTPYAISEVRVGADGCTFRLFTPGGDVPVRMPQGDLFTPRNALSAAAAAFRLGIEAEEIARLLQTFPGVPGRMERLCPEAGLPFSVYIDYAHTEKALREALRSARLLHPARLVVLFGCGGDRDRSKRAPMGEAAAEGADLVYLTCDNCRTESPGRIIKEILPGIHTHRTPCRILFDRERAIRTAIRDARPGDLILLAGKGHETYQIDRHGTHPFDERKIVLQAIAELKRGHTKEG